MSAAHTPGPWQVAEERGASKPFTCYRARNGASPYSLLERMKGDDGREAEFSTEREARTAIALENGDELIDWDTVEGGLPNGMFTVSAAKATGSTSFVGLGQGNGVILTADVDQRVPVTASGAQEETPLVVDFGRDRSEHDFKAAASALPHGCSPVESSHRTPGSTS